MPRKRRLQAKDLFRLALPQSPTLSPDGKSVAFALKRTEAKANRYTSNIHVVPTRGGRIRQLTRGHRMNTAPAWSPNGRWIAFVSNRHDKSQVWLLPTEGGEAKQLTDLEGGPIRELIWSPDSRALLFGHRIQEKKDPKKRKKEATYKHITRLRYKLDGDGYYPEKQWWHLWTVSVPGGRTRQVTFGEEDDWSGRWSPNGKWIAFISNRLPDADRHPDNADVYVARATGGKPRKVTRHFGMAGVPAWSLDGRSIYYLGNYSKDGDWNKHPVHVYRVPARGGRVKDLTPELELWPLNGVVTDTAMGEDLEGGTLQTYGEDGEERLALYLNERGGCRLYSLSARGGPLRPEFTEDVNIVGVSVQPGGEAALVAARMMDVGDVYALRLDGSQKVKRLTQTNRAFFAGLKLTEPEEVVFRNARTRIQGWILRPPGFRKGRRYPTLLEVHGGPMCAYGYTFFHELHLLAAQGYVVAFSNPRGSDGFGTRFRCCIDLRWGTIDYADCMAVVDAMVRKPYVDRKRLGLLGGSYGGFMTTWAISHTNRFKAAVTQRQWGNYYSGFGVSDFGFHLSYQFKGYPWERPLEYLKRSPNYYAGSIRTPLLIIHSEEDHRCPLGMAQELFSSLKMQKKTVELVQFEGEPHGLSRGGKPRNRLERLNRIVAWFESYL